MFPYTTLVPQLDLDEQLAPWNLQMTKMNNVAVDYKLALTWVESYYLSVMQAFPNWSWKLVCVGSGIWSRPVNIQELDRMKYDRPQKMV